MGVGIIISSSVCIAESTRSGYIIILISSTTSNSTFTGDKLIVGYLISFFTNDDVTFLKLCFFCSFSFVLIFEMLLYLVEVKVGVTDFEVLPVDLLLADGFIFMLKLPAYDIYLLTIFLF
jgi:hypothetical protein